MNWSRLKKLLSDYEYGLGFERGDILKPRDGAPEKYVGLHVVVLKQSALNPSQYDVIMERENPAIPSDRFIIMEIRGHDWERATP